MRKKYKLCGGPKREKERECAKLLSAPEKENADRKGKVQDFKKKKTTK